MEVFCVNCRFVVLGNSVAYTTANELGAFLMHKGVKFEPFSNDSNSYHFGTVFNTRLISGLKKSINSSINVGYTIQDFPKLIYNQSDNNDMISYLLSNNLSTITSTAITKEGKSEKALDLYTLTAFTALCNSYNVMPDESCIEILPHTFICKPCLKINERISTEIEHTPISKQKKSLFSL